MPTIIVYSLDHARAALAAATELRVPVTLLSPPGAAFSIGAPLFHAFTSQAAEEYPRARARAVLDCGDAPAAAVMSFRCGLKAVRVRVDQAMRAKLADIASHHNACIETGEDGDRILDLGNCEDAWSTCRNWLTQAEKTL